MSKKKDTLDELKYHLERYKKGLDMWKTKLLTNNDRRNMGYIRQCESQIENCRKNVQKYTDMIRENYPDFYFKREEYEEENLF